MLDVKDWMVGVYLPVIENPNIINQTTPGELHKFFEGGFELVGHYGSRVTFRYYEAKIDVIDQAPPFAPLIYYRKSFTVIDPNNGPMSGEYTSTMNGYLPIDVVQDWKYLEPGTFLTNNEAGGYVIYFEKGSEQKNNQLLKTWILENSPFNVLLGLANFDTIFYSSYYDYYVYCKHLFVAEPSGNTKARMIINVIIKIILYLLKLFFRAFISIYHRKKTLVKLYF